MNTKPNPQPFRISRSAIITLPTATTLLLAVVALLLLAAAPRPAEALIPGGAPRSLPPTVSVSKSSVVVDEGRTATNTGGFDDLGDLDADTVSVSASLGTVAQSGRVTGRWDWSYATPHIPADETKTVTITARNSTGRSSTKSFSLRVVDHGLVQPKVMAYNIVEGKDGLPAVASTIKALNPDIVLLNEVRKYDAFTSFFPPPNGVKDQTKWLADQTGFPYYKYHRTAYTGLTGTKGVAILSQYPISSTDFWELEDENDFLPQWGILKATIPIDGLTHDVFSTRFPPAQRGPGEPGYDPTDRPENEAYHKQAIDIVRSVPSDHAVIFGGDLNANWIESPWATEFRDNSGLTDVMVERPDPDRFEALDARADYIYYRGPYSVYQTQHRGSEALGLPPASDHPYVFAHFLRRY